MGHAVRHAINRTIVRLLIAPIRAYQAVHVAFFRGSCRFHPTCSHYAVEALELHGAARGSWLAFTRLLRCQPFCRGGFDPVPEPRPRHSRSSTSTTPRAQQSALGQERPA